MPKKNIIKEPKDNKSLTCIDLFCGCGGLSLGFHETGFNVIAGIDSWKDALVTHKKNLPESQAVFADLFSFTPQDLKSEYGISDVDVIVGGPPCQGFSIAGKRIVDDKRNKLYKSFVEFVRYYRPQAFVMENVPNLLSLAGGVVRDAIIEDFVKIGYKIVYKVLTASDYGTPQNRRRVFFVGLKKDASVEFEFPRAEFGTNEKPYVTCKEAIDEKQENTFALYLDTQGRLLCEPVLVFRGVLNATPLHPRDIFRLAIRLGAASVIVAHTHPSGDATPSEEDLAETKRLIETGNLVGIPLDDHIVIGCGTKRHVAIRRLEQTELWSVDDVAPTLPTERM